MYYMNRKEELIATYGSWRAIPQQHMQSMQQLDARLNQNDRQIQIPAPPQDDINREYQLATSHSTAPSNPKFNTTTASRVQNSKPQSLYTWKQHDIMEGQLNDELIAERDSQAEGERRWQIKAWKRKESKPKKRLSNGKRKQKKRQHEREAKAAARAQGTARSSIVPNAKKRTASESAGQMSSAEAKRMKPTPIDDPRGQTPPPKDAQRDHVRKVPGMKSRESTLESGFLATSMVYPKPQDQEGNPPPRVLVDYALPSGDDRAEWDSDFLRRAFGEIE